MSKTMRVRYTERLVTTEARAIDIDLDAWEELFGEPFDPDRVAGDEFETYADESGTEFDSLDYVVHERDLSNIESEAAFEPLDEFYVGEVLSMYDDDELRAGVVETLRAVFYTDRPSDHMLDAGEITEREWVESTALQDIEDGEDQVVFDQIVGQWHELEEGRA